MNSKNNLTIEIKQCNQPFHFHLLLLHVLPNYQYKQEKQYSTLPRLSPYTRIITTCLLSIYLFFLCLFFFCLCIHFSIQSISLTFFRLSIFIGILLLSAFRWHYQPLTSFALIGSSAILSLFFFFSLQSKHEKLPALSFFVCPGARRVCPGEHGSFGVFSSKYQKIAQQNSEKSFPFFS